MSESFQKACKPFISVGCETGKFSELPGYENLSVLSWEKSALASFLSLHTQPPLSIPLFTGAM
jgi:hypothetical protein